MPRTRMHTQLFSFTRSHDSFIILSSQPILDPGYYGTETANACGQLTSVVEVKGSEVQSGHMKHVLLLAKVDEANYLVGLDRYAFHISVLRGE
jgi:hypothetical protein